MNIPVILNGEKIFFQADSEEKLSSVLRRNGCLSVKTACAKGRCGSCTVLLNEKPVPSCRLPVALAINQKIETLEGFSKSEEYTAIMKGFEKAGIELCGFCNSGKIFAAHSVICANVRPNRAAVAEKIRHLAPCCTDLDTLINGILYAFEFNSRKKDV